HTGQGLTLQLEPGHDLSGVHPEFEDFHRNAAMHGDFLFGQVHCAEAAFANLLQQAIATANQGVCAVGDERWDGTSLGVVFALGEPLLDAPAQVRVVAAYFFEVGAPVRGGSNLENFPADFLFPVVQSRLQQAAFTNVAVCDCAQRRATTST